MADNINNILDSINNLQTLEQNYIKELDVLTSSSSFTVTDAVTQLINNINNLSDTRIKLFRTIDETYKLLGSSGHNSRSDLVDQITLVKTVEDQLTKAKQNMYSLQNRNDTQMRLVQINNYYGNRYEYQTKLLKQVIILCVILVILFVINKKGIIPAGLFKYIISIVLGVGLYSIIRLLWDINTRNNMNFDEYNWDYEYPATQYPSIMQYNRDHMIDLTKPLMALIGNLGICIGETCCASDLKYDEKAKQCVIPKTSKKTAVETFTTKQLNSTLLIKNDTDAESDAKTDAESDTESDKSAGSGEVSDNGIKPFSYGNDFSSL